MNIARGDWLGKGPLLLFPLYAYFLGFIFILFKNSIATAILVQLCLSSVNCLLIFLIARNIFGIRVATSAGMMAALYLPFLFHDAMITATVLITTLDYLALLLLIRFSEKPSPAFLALSGIALGLATLARSNTLFFLPLVVLWIMCFFPEIDLARRARLCVVLILLMGLVISPVTLRNYLVAGEKTLVSSQGGINFFMGNNPSATGKFMPPKGMRSDQFGLMEDAHRAAERATGRKLTSSEADNFWIRHTLALIADNPMSFVSLLAKKFIYFWNAYEIPDSLNYYFVKRFVGVLRIPLFSFSIVGPLGILGLLLSLRGKDRRTSLLYLFLASYVSFIVLFIVTGRYRLTIVPLLIIFAAFSLDWIYTRIAAREYKPLWLSLMLLPILLVVTNFPIEKSDFSASYNNLGIVLLNQGKLGEARQAFQEAVEIMPSYADARSNLGTVYFYLGEKELARQAYERAVSLEPQNPAFRKNLQLVAP